MVFKIMSRWDNTKVLFEGEAENLRGLVVSAVKANVYLQRANLQGANLEGANLQRINLEGANLQGINLQGANLQGGNLQGTNLQGANLEGAYLQGANLEGAYLQGANLEGANLQGINLKDIPKCQYRHPLQILRDQPGKILAYKAVTLAGSGPYATNGLYENIITYKVGDSYEVLNANTDECEVCGAGIHVATLDWCQSLLASLYNATRILIMEFEAKDIAAIPHAGDGKFRLFRCKVIGEWTPDQDPRTGVSQPIDAVTKIAGLPTTVPLRGANGRFAKAKKI